MSTPHCRTVEVLDITSSGSSSPGEEIFRLKLAYPGWESGWRAGQFVMIRPLSWSLDLVWGRPFSISTADETGLTLLFQIAGRGTRRLAELQMGDQVKIWGPLGTFFKKPTDRPVLILAGGMGIAPFCGYVATHPRPENVKLFFAHRPPLADYLLGPLAARVEDIRERTPEDIPAIAARMEELIRDCGEHRGLVVACGPMPFLRTVRSAALKYGTDAELSLENRMACGVGACLGCVTKDTQGHHLQVCTRGPVFNATAISLEG